MHQFLKSFFTLCCLLVALATQAQAPEMADVMRSNGKIYVVVAVLAIIFTGLAVYLIMIDRKVGKIEKEIDANRD